MDSKGFPQSSVLAAQAIRQGMEQEGQPGAYRKLFPDHQSSQRPPGRLEWGVEGGAWANEVAGEQAQSLQQRLLPGGGEQSSASA